MPIQATAAHGRGPSTDPDPLVLCEAEYDSLAWILTLGHDLAHDATEGKADDLRRSMLSMHAAWVGPLMHTPRFTHDEHVIVDMPAPEHRRALAGLLRLLAAVAAPNAHPTGMVFYIPARDAATLADRIEGVR